jgi:hypothetical protein
MVNITGTPRTILAAALRRDASFHESGQFDAIGEGYDDAEGELLPLEERRERDVGIAISFWDGWIDSRNHDWQYYEGITQKDWPILAHMIASALEARDPISDSRVLEHFAPENQQSFWSRLKGWMGGTDPDA